MTDARGEGGRGEALLRAENFSLRVAGRTLLAGAFLAVRRGELLLLIGPSGAGKSLFLQLLASVLRPGENDLEANGRLELDGVDLMTPRGARSPGAGLVFQDHALFDDLSAAENLEFAFDHSKAPPKPQERARKVAALLTEFGLAGVPHVKALSGGQKQRLAVARTLAQDPELLIYDEPTTGLDPANAGRVAERIATTHRQHGKTSIVVTHDHAALLPLADRVILLDPRSQKFREVAKADAGRELFECAQPAAEAAPRKHGHRPLALLAASGAIAIEIARSIARLVPRWPVTRWGLRALIHQLKLVAFPAAILYMAIAGVILGVVTTYFTFRYLPMKHYTEPLLVDEILAGLGFLLFRVLSPALATLLIAARAGAAVTADLGNRAYGRQLDALRSLGIEPAAYYRTAVDWAFLIGTPILCGVTFLVATAVSEVVFVVAHHPEQSAFFWRVHYFRLFVDPASGAVEGLWWTLAKVETAGFGVGAIAYAQGVHPKRAGADVGGAITRTILWATLWVLAVHTAYAFLEF